MLEMEPVVAGVQVDLVLMQQLVEMEEMGEWILVLLLGELAG